MSERPSERAPSGGQEREPRPEAFRAPIGTQDVLPPASAARAFVQHRPPTPWKVWCITPVFRYERPQAGRLRQHHQLDVEVLGAADPDVDVEIVALGAAYLAELGLQRWRLVI